MASIIDLIDDSEFSSTTTVSKRKEFSSYDNNDILDLTSDTKSRKYDNDTLKAVDLTGKTPSSPINLNNLIQLLSQLSNLSNIPNVCDEKGNIANKSIIKSKSSSIKKTTPKSFKSTGWAQGVGYGGGHAHLNDWDSNKYIQEQLSKDSSLTENLSNIYNELSKLKSNDSEDNEYIELIKSSCLLPFLESYLRNDSILEIERHLIIYNSIFEILDIFASINDLKTLLFPSDKLTDSIGSFVEKIRNNLDSFSRNSLRKANNSNKETSIFSDLGISVLNNSPQLLRIHEVSIRISSIYNKLKRKLLYKKEEESSLLIDLSDDVIKVTKKESIEINTSSNDDQSNNKETIYINVMKPLKYTEIPTLNNYHYNNLLSSLDTSSNIKSRLKRLAQEHADLSSEDSSLLSWSSSVWIRACESRMDILQVMISGPAETPYSNGLYIFDIFFPSSYPSTPPKVNLQTTGKGTVRFNPNLYNCGKVCLSLLGTWAGSKSESWDEKISTFRQVLISIQSLILVSEPYFNEPGFESTIGTATGEKNSNNYNQNIREKSVIWAMLDHLKYPKVGFEEVIKQHFLIKRDEIIAQVNAWTVTNKSPIFIKSVDDLRNELYKLY